MPLNLIPSRRPDASGDTRRTSASVLRSLSGVLRARPRAFGQDADRIGTELTASAAATNELLRRLHASARTLPSSLDLRETLERARQQLVATFRPQVICLLEFDESHDEWVPKLAEGAILRPSCSTEELPAPLRAVVGATRATLVDHPPDDPHDAIAPGSGSGLYVRLAVGERTVGLLGLEHPLPGRFNVRDRALLDELAGTLALDIDNARWFGRLRSLGSQEERVRVAGGLHDRLGQWLTYISLELERIIAGRSEEAPELVQLYTDVQGALDELRDALRQLRSGIDETRSLGSVAAEVIDRFTERTGLDVELRVVHPHQRLPVPVENELLRILQEGLSNVDRHSRASKAIVTWDCVDGWGALTLTDDGVGFERHRGIRDNAYGLVGMRERADVIGAHLTVSSAPGEGTTISVTVAQASPRPPAKKES